MPDGGLLETADGSGYFTVYYADSSYPSEIVVTDFQPGVIPEPTSLALLCGTGALVMRRRAGKTSKIDV